MISISRELAALGWAVEVFASPPESDLGLDSHGVLWAPHWAYPMAYAQPGSGGADVFVAWRFAEALAVGEGSHQRFLWLHDEVMRQQ